MIFEVLRNFSFRALVFSSRIIEVKGAKWENMFFMHQFSFTSLCSYVAQIFQLDKHKKLKGYKSTGHYSSLYKKQVIKLLSDNLETL